MTPYEIGIVLHYYAKAAPYPEGYDVRTPLWKDTIEWMVQANVLETLDSNKLEIGACGEVFVQQGLMKVELPELHYCYPEKK